METNKKIDYRFKLLYAIAIIMVCSTHTYGGGISLLSDWFPYSGIQLALFVFAGGYFYNFSYEEHLGKYILKKIKKFLVPLYIYNLIYGIFANVLKYAGFTMGERITFYSLFIYPITNGHQFIYNLGGWFIVPLFMVEILNILIHNIIHDINNKTPEIVFLIISILLGIGGNSLACRGITSGWWIVLVRMLYFIPFYEFGIFYKSVLEKYDKKIPSFWYFSVLFVIQLIIIMCFGKVPSYTPSWCNDFVDGPVMPLVVGFLGIALWMRIVTILEPVIGKSKFVNLIADNTYSIMMNHLTGFMIVKTIYGLISKIYAGFSDFNWEGYKSNIWYYYVPRGMTHTLIIYVIAGICFSIGVQKLIDLLVKESGKISKHIVLKLKKE